MSTESKSKQGAQGAGSNLLPTSRRFEPSAELVQLGDEFQAMYKRFRELSEHTQSGVLSLIRIMSREEIPGDREQVAALAASWRARGYGIQARMLDELLEIVFQPPLELLLERATQPSIEEKEPSVPLQPEPELDLGPKPDIELPEPGEPLP